MAPELLIAIFAVLLIPYGYVLVRVCAMAWFRARASYTRAMLTGAFPTEERSGE